MCFLTQDRCNYPGHQFPLLSFFLVFLLKEVLQRMFHRKKKGFYRENRLHNDDGIDTANQHFELHFVTVISSMKFCVYVIHWQVLVYKITTTGAPFLYNHSTKTIFPSSCHDILIISLRCNFFFHDPISLYLMIVSTNTAHKWGKICRLTMTQNNNGQRQATAKTCTHT